MDRCGLCCEYISKQSDSLCVKDTYVTLFFCSEDCIGTFKKTNVCHFCNSTEKLKVAINGLAYCTYQWVGKSCYEKYMSGIDMLIDGFSTYLNECRAYDNFDHRDWYMLKSKINTMLDKKCQDTMKW